jgi:ubiquinone/menaquinone biosynthesis C-methylase UbiE
MKVEELALEMWLRLPLSVRTSGAAQMIKRGALKVLRRPAATVVPPSTSPAPIADARPAPPAAPRVIRTLPELDEMLKRLDDAALVSDDELRRGFQTFVMDLQLGLPSDPYSPEYRARVFELYQFLRGESYELSAESTIFDYDAAVVAPFPYSTGSAQTVGDQLLAVGHIVKTMALPPGSRVLELGPGWGNTTLALAQMGHHVTAVDIDPSFCNLIAERASRMGVEIDVRQGDFSSVETIDSTFDAVLFFESFHHSADHLHLLEQLDRIVAPGGSLVFAAEPVSDTLPAPWCLRLDGESLWAIRRNGWFELGFQERYFVQTLERFGWTTTKSACTDTPWGLIFVARRATAHPLAAR